MSFLNNKQYMDEVQPHIAICQCEQKVKHALKQNDELLPLVSSEVTEFDFSVYNCFCFFNKLLKLW